MFNVVVKSEINQTLALSLSVCIPVSFSGSRRRVLSEQHTPCKPLLPSLWGWTLPDWAASSLRPDWTRQKNNNNRVSLLDEKRAHMDISSSLSQLFALITWLGGAGAGNVSQSKSSHLSLAQSDAQMLTRRSALTASQSSFPSRPYSLYCSWWFIKWPIKWIWFLDMLHSC